MIVMPKRLADDVARRVRALIEEQQLEAGMRLPAERQLAAQLGVSRNSLREALAMLVNEGVLLSRRGGGTFVRFQHEPWSEQNIVQPLKTLLADDPDYSFDILEARHAIEASTAWHAAMRATDADKEKIRLCFEATQSEDPDIASQTDVRFHLAIAEASHNALTLKYLDGGHGKGCNEADDAFTLMRRRFHHFTFYGFMLCFAATVVATGYHYFAGIEAPYPFFSVPVMLGTLGGIGLVVGPAGLLWLNLKRSPLHGDARQKPMDRGFILLLLLTSLTGLALLAGRDTSWMAILLAIHLGVVMALFLTIPYGKFAHGFYRCAALLKWAIEKRRGKQAGVTGD